VPQYFYELLATFLDVHNISIIDKVNPLVGQSICQSIDNAFAKKKKKYNEIQEKSMIINVIKS